MKTTEEIYQTLLAAFAQRAGFTPEADCDLAVRLYAAAAELQALGIQSEWVLDQSFPQTARGVYLDYHAQMRGIARTAATKAVGTLRFSVERAPSTALRIAAGTVCMTEIPHRASEQDCQKSCNGYTPAGLLVKERTVSAASLVLKAAGNLMDATTTEDATSVVNSVAIYDKNGNFLRRLGDAASQELVGVMEAHVTQGEGSDVTDQANRLLEDGKQQRTVTVHVLGDLSLITGETVVVQEHKTGLEGIFWIDADVHTWKNHNYDTMLTLNCRNVATTASAGR